VGGGIVYLHYNASFENPIFYRVDSTYGFGFRDGLMLRHRWIGRCGGAAWLYLEPLWFAGKTKRSYHKDQLANFLKELKPVLPMLPRHFPLNATWKLTPEELDALDKFNAEFARTLNAPLKKNEKLLVLKLDCYAVWVQGGKFVVERWFDDEKKWKVVDEKPGLRPEQADEALAEWNRRATLK
jgi:hypothetical protein